ncbi:MAG TPA: hypothetical protein VGI96_31510 [Streptosporangiaceae bacterium]
MASRTIASNRPGSSGVPRLAAPAATRSAADKSPATTWTVAPMFGLVVRSGCQRTENSSREPSTTSAESVPVSTITACEPNSAAISAQGSSRASSSVTTSRSTSDSSCQVPAPTEPNTATARIRSSPA